MEDEGTTYQKPTPDSFTFDRTEPMDTEPSPQDQEHGESDDPVGVEAHRILAADPSRPEAEEDKPNDPAAQGDRTRNAIVLGVETRALPVKLDDAAVAAKGRDAAEKWRRLLELKGELASTKKGYAERIKEAEAEFSAVMGVVASGSEMLPVRCEEIPDWTTRMVQLVRTDLEPDDPRYVVERRGMRQNELQYPLQLGAPDAQPSNGQPTEPLPSEPHPFEGGKGKRNKGVCRRCGSDEADPVHGEPVESVVPTPNTDEVPEPPKLDEDTEDDRGLWLGHNYVGPAGTILCGEPSCGKERAAHGPAPERSKRSKPKSKAKAVSPIARAKARKK